MDTYSYNRGEKIGEMLYNKMFHVDVFGFMGDHGSWIQINGDEMNHLTRLRSFHKKSNKVEDWDKVVKYQNDLDVKYLSNSISEYIDIDEDINVKEFKDGLVMYLWNTDFCSYSLDNPKITIDDNIVTVELKLDK